jgi:hypothetical protein
MATRKIINPSITHVVVGGNKEVELEEFGWSEL